MLYMQGLLNLNHLSDLICQVDLYPVSRDELLRIARENGFPEEVVAFLSLFGKEITFVDPDDFLAQAEELELLVYDEREMPPETVRSPQD
jgi:hypothetical protein